jgi:hypothetical protein
MRTDGEDFRTVPHQQHLIASDSAGKRTSVGQQRRIDAKERSGAS